MGHVPGARTPSFLPMLPMTIKLWRLYTSQETKW